MQPKKTFIVLALALFFVVGLTGCRRLEGLKAFFSKPADPQVIATVNGEKITLKDFQREVALRSKRDPSFRITPATLTDQMELMIDRKLMIQEAMDRKLTQEESFVRSIRNYWEQTLVRELIGDVSKELETSVFVTEDEIQEAYTRLSGKEKLPPLDQIREKLKEEIRRRKERAAFERWLSEKRRKADIQIHLERAQKAKVHAEQPTPGIETK